MIRTTPTVRKKVAALDTIAKTFLGTGDVTVVDGAKSDQGKQQTFQEKLLIQEACTHGDALIAYVGAHGKLTLDERAWGFALAVLCARDEFPDGGEKFDELADAGGDTATTVMEQPASSGDVAVDTPIFTDDEQAAAAHFAERMAEYIASKKQAMALSNPQAAYGIGRAFHTLRNAFPAGVAVFDEIARRAGTYFTRNKGK